MQALQIIIKENTIILTNQIKALEIFTDEENKIVTNNMQIIEKLTLQKIQALEKFTSDNTQTYKLLLRITKLI